MNIKKELYEKLHSKYPDFIWKPKAMFILKIASPFIKRFKVEVEYEEALPKDGSIILAQNHSNFYDSLVFEKALKKNNYCCFASDEPRGQITGLSFEAKGVVWVKRKNSKSTEKSLSALTELLENEINISWCPEGTWNITDNKLMLTIAYGLAKAAIEASKTTKVYITPVAINYIYKNNTAKVKKATVKICKAIEITSNMDYKLLTELITDTFWTARWYQLEKNAGNDKKNTIRIEEKENNLDNRYIKNNYVYQRKNETKEKREEFIEQLKKQYKTDWNFEAGCEIKTKEQEKQEKVAADLEKIDRILEEHKIKKITRALSKNS